MAVITSTHQKQCCTCRRHASDEWSCISARYIGSITRCQ